MKISLIMCIIKAFNRFECNKKKTKNKKHIFKFYLQFFTSERVLIKHNEKCFIINGKKV